MWSYLIIVENRKDNMFELMKKRIYSILKISKCSSIKYDGIKITVIYFTVGFLWIYLSGIIVNKIAVNNELFLIIDTYKGWIYVVVTSFLLYLLISGLIKKVELSEKKLSESYEELSLVNEELEAYVQQLTASEEELRIQYEQTIESERKYKNLVNKMQQGLAIYEAVVNENNKIVDFKFLDANENYQKIIEEKKEGILGKSICQIFPYIDEYSLKRLINVVKTGKSVSYERHYKDKEKSFEVTAYKPKELQLAIIATDITERRQMEDRLEYLSYHDQLTGLYNRRFFESDIKLIDEDKNLPLTVIMADVNGLKLINDSFGHSFGDELIKKASEILKNGCREEDVIVRLGGDEFIIFMPKVDTYGAEKFIKSIKAASSSEKINSVSVSISFGYMTKKDKEENILEILKKAEDYMYKKKLLESPSMRGKSINTIITTLHEKNKREEAHSYRVSQLCESMGKAINLDDDEIKELKTVGLLHDIGKIAIEENILNKNGKLTDEEWEEIKRHPEIGYRILSTVNEMSEIAIYVLAHHERWDGKGYPKGLAGEDIPLKSRIITIADSYDAMVSERSYRGALPKEVAIEELKRGKDTQFDSKLVDIFIEEVLAKEV